MTREHILRAALAKYPFRDPYAHEDAESYLAALVRHLTKHDWALAHELRIGKAQADWTPAEVDEFERRMKALPRSSHELTPGVHAFPALESGSSPVTDAALLDLAGERLAALMAMRQDDPEKNLPIVATVLLMSGKVLTALTGSDDRIAILKVLARETPVFGFVLVFDAFIHQVEKGTRATKRDALVEHIGTRDLRLVRSRPYRLEGRRAVFDVPPPPDIDGRDHARYDIEDPYAEIFVSVPVTDGPPS